MYTKKNSRTTYRNLRRPGFKKSGGYQNSKGRNKGNISQQYNKYLKMAKEAFRSGDRIQSEYYYQFTDHYFRLMVDLGINFEENVSPDDIKHESNEDQSREENSVTSIETDDSKSNDESIESIPFIAEPTKDKRSRSPK